MRVINQTLSWTSPLLCTVPAMNKNAEIFRTICISILYKLRNLYAVNNISIGKEEQKHISLSPV